MKHATRVLTAMLIAIVSAGAGAQTYPAKPVVLIVPFAPGGPLDTVARPLAHALGKPLRQTMVIENVGGAGGNIGVARAARAAPDGYTLLIHHIGMSTSPSLYRKLDYDPLNDFEYIGLVGDSTSMLLARRDFPATDFRSFVAYVKANKDKLTFANTGPGGAIHLCSLLIMNAIQTDVTTVPYKSSGLALNDLVAGRVDMMCDSVSTAATQLKAGKVRVIGATSRYRSAALPDIPTLDEQGLKGFEITNWVGLYAPKKTPRPVIDQLVAALQASLRDTEFTGMLARMDYKVATPEQATPAALGERLKSEIAKWAPIIKRAAIYAD
jgi:tripartite-type tricarboxylate transporter receptor subunit TctC